MGAVPVRNETYKFASLRLKMLYAGCMRKPGSCTAAPVHRHSVSASTSSTTASPSRRTSTMSSLLGPARRHALLQALHMSMRHVSVAPSRLHSESSGSIRHR